MCLIIKHIRVSCFLVRFPADFMFELTKEEYESLRCKIFTSNKRGGNRYLPFAFTQAGVAMLTGPILAKLDVALCDVQLLSLPFMFRLEVTLRPFALTSLPLI